MYRTTRWYDLFIYLSSVAILAQVILAQVCKYFVRIVVTCNLFGGAFASPCFREFPDLIFLGLAFGVSHCLGLVSRLRRSPNIFAATFWVGCARAKSFSSVSRAGVRPTPSQISRAVASCDCAHPSVPRGSFSWLGTTHACV